MSELEKFKEAIKPFIDGWNSIEVRAVCFFAYNKWVSLGIRITLSEKLSKDIVQPITLPEFYRFKAFYEVHDINKLDDVLAQIKKGVLRINTEEVNFGSIENNNIKTVSPSFSLLRNYRYDSRPFSNFNFPSIILRGSGGIVHSLLYNHSESIGQEYFDRYLRSYKIPYTGLDDFLTSYLEIPKPTYGHIEDAIVEIIAPILIRLTDCKISDEKIFVKIESVGYKNLDNLQIGIIEDSSAISSLRTSYVLTEGDLKQENGFLNGYKEVPRDRPGASSNVILLSFRNEYLDMMTVRDPSALLGNPRIKIYDHFDKDLKVLNKYLESSNPEEFEKGISLLLYFCGFNTGAYGLIKGKKGISGIQEEIDLITFAPDNHVIAVECTTKEIDTNEKISKFSRRIKEVRDLLGEYTIVPLVFTALERNKISKSDLEKAGKEGVGVVAIENIKELLELAGKQKQPLDILIYLDSLVEEVMAS